MLDVVGLRGGVVGPVSFGVAAGVCLAVMGPSGSGKSVLLRMVADLDPHEGLVSLDGVARGAVSGPAWRRRVMYVAPESGWWLDGVAAHFGAELAAARGLADRLGVRAEVLAGPVAQMSSGERQRLALIRALVLRPRVLLLDEPTGALDQESVARVEAVLRERLAEGVVMVLVTHDPAQAERLGGQRMRMAAGRLS